MLQNYIIRKVMDNKQTQEYLPLLWGYSIALDSDWFKRVDTIKCKVIGSNLSLLIGVVKSYVEAEIEENKYLDIYTHDRYYCLQEEEKINEH